MIRDEVKALLHQGKHDEIIDQFESGGCHVTHSAIAQRVLSVGLSAHEIFKLFLNVLDFTSPLGKQVSKEDMQEVRNQLKLFLPVEIVDASNPFTEGIPTYLDSHEVNVDDLFNILWDALRIAKRDDKTIGIGWGAFLCLSM